MLQTIPELGKFIVFEGLDCSFKETNSNKLYEYIKENHPEINVKIVHFPRYGEPACCMVEKYLGAGIKNNMALTSFMKSLPFLFDMVDYFVSEGIEHLRNKGWIIADRYWYSNIFYRGAENCPTIEDDYVMDLMLRASMYNIFDDLKKMVDKMMLPSPDFVFLMKSHFRTVKEKLESKETNLDEHTKNLDYIKNVMKCYDLFNFMGIVDYENIPVYDKLYVDNDPNSSYEVKIKSEKEIFNHIKEVFESQVMNNG